MAEGMTITLNPYEQDAYLSARPSQVHDVFMELCSRILIIGKRVTSNMMKRDKNPTKLDSLCSQLEESASNLQSALSENNNLLARNQNLEAKINHWKNLCTEAERVSK